MPPVMVAAQVGEALKKKPRTARPLGAVQFYQFLRTPTGGRAYASAPAAMVAGEKRWRRSRRFEML